MNEAVSPPTEEMYRRRDIEFVRLAQLRFVEGYRARLSELHPMKRDRNGKETQQREPKWCFSDRAAARCPGRDAGERTDFGVRTPVPPWPSHERERWIAGWDHADAVCATRGLAAARSADPAKVKRARLVALAETLEAFPDAILSRQDATAYRARQERIRHGQAADLAPTLPDAEKA